MEPAEIAMLPLEAKQHIADMYNLIEAGCPWPQGMNNARAAFLEKESGETDNPLGSGCFYCYRSHTGNGPALGSSPCRNGYPEAR